MKKLFILLTLLLLPSICYGAAPTRSHSYVSGQSISPTEVTTNEDNIFSYLSAGVDTYKANSITGDALISSLAITSSGNMTFSGTTNISGTLQLGGTAITSSAAELNLVDGLTSSASELNILDGATLNTAELNYVDGVTSNIQTQINALGGATGSTSIITLGTITTGGWAATAIPVAYGGTGSTTAANARTALGLAISSDVQAYNVNTTTLGSDIALASEVSGTLPIANGGTGSTTTILPAGIIQMYGGTSAPTGWLACDGSAVNRTTYADLFTAISTTYGVGNGSTTFNLPNFTSKMPRGNTAGTGGGADTFSLTIAEANLPSHTHTGPSHTHTVGTLAGPSHTHTGGAHTHALESWYQDGAAISEANALVRFITQTTNQADPKVWQGNASYYRAASDGAVATAAGGTGAITGAMDAGGTGATGAIGSGTAKTIDTLPAYTSVMFIIKY